MSKIMRVGMVGAGHIAAKVSKTLARMDGAECLAVGSRSLEKAEAFAAGNGFKRAYGSYGELLDDADVDLVYVATPHSHHFEPTMEAIAKGKPCLVEKAFMANAAQTEAVLGLAKEKGVFVAEALWTRYQPSRGIIDNLIREGRIGRLRSITASLSYSIEWKPRITRPDLCGGALLDLGVYAINFVRMVCPNPIEKVDSQSVLSPTGIDLSETIALTLEGGILASIQSSACCAGFNTGVIAGSEGCIVVDNVNNPQLIRVYRTGGILDEEIPVPERISGYEYEFLACRDAIWGGLTEPPQMPHSETLLIMRLMDSLRRKWGVRFPMDPPGQEG